MRDLAGWAMAGYLAVLLTLTFYPFGGNADVPLEAALGLAIFLFVGGLRSRLVAAG